jgi:hypothetical protein
MTSAIHDIHHSGRHIFLASHEAPERHGPDVCHPEPPRVSVVLPTHLALREEAVREKA